MSFFSKESSKEGGNPVELYMFSLGSILWHYTNSTKSVVVGDITYESANIQRSKIAHTRELNKVDLTITTPWDFPPGKRFRTIAPSLPMGVKVSKMHLDDTDEDNIAVLWQGVVSQVAWKGGTSDLVCEPLSISLKRSALSRYYTRPCSHSLFGGACGVDKARFGVELVSPRIDGLVVSSPSFTDPSRAVGWFDSGYLSYTTQEGLDEVVTIYLHTAGQVTIANHFIGGTQGVTITAYPGCDHGPRDCTTKFSNIANYGGFPHIPKRSPFDFLILF